MTFSPQAFHSIFNLLGFNEPALLKKYVQDPVRKKFPNISVEFTQGAKFQQMVTSGDVPELFLFWYADLRAVAALKALVPLDPFMKQQRFDMNTIVPSAWQSVKNLADSDQIMAAFDVLQVIASPEVQTMMSEDGIIPVLADKNVQERSGKTATRIRGKIQKPTLCLSHPQPSTNRIFRMSTIL